MIFEMMHADDEDNELTVSVNNSHVSIVLENTVDETRNEIIMHDPSYDLVAFMNGALRQAIAWAHEGGIPRTVFFVSY